MPRRKTIYTDEHPYHISVRSNNRDWFDLPLSYCYPTFIKYLAKTQEMYDFEPHLFLLMDNHFHLLVSTPKSNISQGMRYFLTESSRQLRIDSLRINHIFGGRYGWSLIKSQEYYAHVFKYIIRNPVAAKMVGSVESHIYSTFFSDLHKAYQLTISEPSEHHLQLPTNADELLQWLNIPLPSELEEGIKKGLRRSQFEFPHLKKTKRAADWSAYLPKMKRRVEKK